MKIGLSSACFYPEVLTEDSIKLITDIGFNTGEIFLNSNSEYEDGFIGILNEERLRHGFEIKSVHSFSSAFEPYLFEIYDRRRQDMFKYFKKVCRAAKLLGADYYTFHGMRKVDFNSMNRQHVVDIYDKLIYTALEEGVVLAQENVSWCMSSDTRFLELLRDRCRYPVKYTLDIKQSFRAGVDLQSYLDAMGGDLVNLHVNDRNEDRHCLLPGMGSVDYEELLKKLTAIGYKGDMIIEVYRENFKKYDELACARDFLTRKL
ncbi:MAG: endonuclease, family 2 superfamily protein [Firmicutes bacterium]|nr:endonuclease, family 2 superfamily protein [Bacillota bacterium]